MEHVVPYELLQCFSKGGQYTHVYHAKHTESDTHVAIKKINMLSIHPTQQKECETEITLLQTMDHPNLIQYHEHFCRENVLYIVMELAGGHMAKG